MTKEGMQEPFARFEKDFPEMYEVVRAVIVVRNQRIYKIEVLKDHTAPARFKIHYSLEERLEIKPMDSKEKEFKKVWIDLTLPWVETDDADSALNQAMFRISQIEP